MKNLFLKCILIVFLLFILVDRCVANSEQDSIDELRYLSNQISAVTIDMYLYLGWYFESNKDWVDFASKKSVNDLDDIKKKLDNLYISKDCNVIKEKLIVLTKSLKNVYVNITQKDLNIVEKDLIALNKIYSEVWQKINKKSKNLFNKNDALKKVNSLSQELSLIDNYKDKEIYKNVLRLIMNRRYEKAYNILNKLRKFCKGKIFEYCIMVKMEYCVAMIHDEFIAKDGTNVGIYPYDLLLEVINSKVYSPVLFEAFANWRLIDKELFHGMSNFSHIPNLEYNKKAWEIVKIIKQYLKDNPEDLWAKCQIEGLLNLDNISRGGLMGNYVLSYGG